MKFKICSLLTFIFCISASTFGLAANGIHPHFDKVIWIVFENKNFATTMAQADFKKLIPYGAFLTNMKAETHPSQPNYIAMIAGSTMNVTGDSNVNLKGEHIGDLLEEAKMDWRVYAENYPGKCYLGSGTNHYARKHVPFLSFTNVTTDPKRCAKIVNADTFDADYAADKLPEFTMYVPNLLNDGHDTSTDYAGKWLTKKFGKTLSTPNNLKNTLFIITFDENGGKSGNQIYTLLIGDQVKPGSYNIAANHVSLLALIEDEFHIGDLGRNDAKAAILDQIWK